MDWFFDDDEEAPEALKKHMKDTKSDRPAGSPKYQKVINVNATSWDGEYTPVRMSYVDTLGKGAFGTVLRMTLENKRNEDVYDVALKHPEGPERLNSEERQILLALQHENLCNLLFYYTDAMRRSHLILEYMEGDLFHWLRKHYSAGKGLKEYLEVFAYQLSRALAFCHSNAVIHRDLKPENCLVNSRGTLKLTDFGCSLLLRAEDEDRDMIFYIGTLVFRSPELILGSRRYSGKCDIWSMGIVFSEMIIGLPIFYTKQGAKQHLSRIFEHIGMPTDEDFNDMNCERISLPAETDLKYTSIEERVAECKLKYPEDQSLAIDLLGRMLIFSPANRPTAWEVCAHEFFDVLWDPERKLPKGIPMPQLFNFTPHEKSAMPDWVRERFGIT